jgi:acetylornithine deacetylase/succinyl-diaminopimelate desuccinylase family protein
LKGFYVIDSVEMPESNALQPTSNRLSDVIDSYRSDILEFAKELIAIRTENPPGRLYRECAKSIENKLREIGLDYNKIEIPSKNVTSESDSRYCILSFYGQGKKTLYFHGHYDVVPASNESQFHPYVEDDKLVGRGSADMKGGLAAMIYAVKAIEACGIQLTGKIGLTIVPDEETGGLNGSQYLARAGLLGKDAIGMITPEPSPSNLVIWNANRGAISLRITVKGTPAHVGLHYQGVNAFELMLRVAKRLQDLKTQVEANRTKFRIQPEAAQRSILLMGGQCTGGTIFNLVPAECSFTVDRRINPEEDLETEKQRLLSILDDLREEGIRLEVEVLQEGKSSGSSENSPVAQMLASSVEQITGKRPIFELCPALCEIRFYAERGIPAFSYGPGLLSVSHGPSECVNLADLLACAKIYAMTAARILSS